jgi:hypothetical protein
MLNSISLKNQFCNPGSERTDPAQPFVPQNAIAQGVARRGLTSLFDFRNMIHE